MKPLYQILEITKEFLAPNYESSTDTSSIFICQALSYATDAEKISLSEYRKAKKFIMGKIYPALTLFALLRLSNTVSKHETIQDENYGVYRDAWLNKQIANLKAQIRKPKPVVLKVGDKVKVMRNGKEFAGKDGFDNSWVDQMSLAIGRTYTISGIRKTGVSFVEQSLYTGFATCFYRPAIYEYPPQVLKKVK